MDSSTTPPAGLDFASIRQQYPAAFAALEKHLRFDWVIAQSGQLGYLHDEGVETPVAMQYNPRDLFDFFDQKGVYVMVNTRGIQRLPVWSYEIECENGGVYQSNYPTRTTAESAAFMAAFGKLEEMLKQEKG